MKPQCKSSCTLLFCTNNCFSLATSVIQLTKTEYRLNKNVITLFLVVLIVVYEHYGLHG